MADLSLIMMVNNDDNYDKSRSKAVSWNITCLVQTCSLGLPPLLNRDTLWLPATLLSQSAVCSFQRCRNMDDICGLQLIQWWWGGGHITHSGWLRLVRTQEQAKTQNPKSFKDKPKTYYHYLCYAKLLSIQCSRLWSRGQAHCDSGANGSPAQANGGEETYWSIP